MRKALPLLLLAGAGLYVFSQVQSFGKTMTVRLGGIAFDAAKTRATAFFKAIFNVKLIVNNASGLQGVIKGGKLALIFNNKIVGGVDRIAETTVNAGSNTIVPLEVSINTLNLVGNITDIIRMVGSGMPIKFKVVGTLVTNYGNLEINEEQSVSL